MPSGASLNVNGGGLAAWPNMAPLVNPRPIKVDAEWYSNSQTAVAGDLITKVVGEAF